MPTPLRLASIVAQGRPGTANRGLWRKGAAIASDSGLWEKGFMPLLPLLGPLLAAAQPAPQSDAAITVEASRITPEQARIASTAYARAGLPPNPNYGQYARWQGPICASVRGIPDPAVAGLVLPAGSAAVIGGKSREALRLAKEALNGIEVGDVDRFYRFEQGFTLEMYMHEDSQKSRDAFVEHKGKADF